MRIIRATSIVPAIVRTVADFLIHAGGFPLFRIRFAPEKFNFDACGKTMLSACFVFKPWLSFELIPIALSLYAYPRQIAAVLLNAA